MNKFIYTKSIRSVVVHVFFAKNYVLEPREAAQVTDVAKWVILLGEVVCACDDADDFPLVVADHL